MVNARTAAQQPDWDPDTMDQIIDTGCQLAKTFLMNLYWVISVYLPVSGSPRGHSDTDQGVSFFLSRGRHHGFSEERSISSYSSLGKRGDSLRGVRGRISERRKGELLLLYHDEEIPSEVGLLLCWCCLLEYVHSKKTWCLARHSSRCPELAAWRMRVESTDYQRASEQDRAIMLQEAEKKVLDRRHLRGIDVESKMGRFYQEQQSNADQGPAPDMAAPRYPGKLPRPGNRERAGNSRLFNCIVPSSCRSAGRHEPGRSCVPDPGPQIRPDWPGQGTRPIFYQPEHRPCPSPTGASASFPETA
ncbi:hypothetical protein F4778DRAFT_124254 [Xylariomycetidae sp. FL2044]|nr:hypothetical protein F4778DRAFT_124254 [Xylariomycetidae sp. FL2044]